MARKKVPQSARLSAGGGVQSLFGQCPNGGGVKNLGSSLSAEWRHFSKKTIHWIVLFISEIAEKVITRCLVDEERDVGVVSKDEVVQHLGSTEVSHTTFVTLILIVTSSFRWNLAIRMCQENWLDSASSLIQVSRIPSWDSNLKLSFFRHCQQCSEETLTKSNVEVN